MDVPARWVDEINSGQEGTGSPRLLLEPEVDLLVKETVPSAFAAVPGAGSEAGRHESSITSSTLPHTSAQPRARRVRNQLSDRYMLLKKYEGVVTHRDADSFTARLCESPGDFPILEVEFDHNELPEHDRPLAVEGTPLVWTIGYEYVGSTCSRKSQIYLRRLPPITAAEMDRGLKEIGELMRAIPWE